MTDKQRLIYDLSLQCAMIDVQRSPDAGKPLQAAMLDAFTSYVFAYSCMDGSKLSAALDELKKAAP